MRIWRLNNPSTLSFIKPYPKSRYLYERHKYTPSHLSRIYILPIDQALYIFLFKPAKNLTTTQTF